MTMRQSKLIAACNRRLVLHILSCNNRRMKNTRKFIYVLFALVFVLCSAASGKAQEIVKRRANESIKEFALRMIPAKTELAHDAIQGAFATSTKNLVILYSDPNAPSSVFSGLVLTPVTEDTYQKFLLPIEAEIPGRFEITAEAVFFANADKDEQQELIIAYSIYRNGTGEKEGHAVHIFDWNGGKFVALTAIENKLSGLATAKAIRAKLKALGY